MLVHELEEAIKSGTIAKMNNKRQAFNIDEYEILAKDIINYINKLDVSSNTKGDLHRHLQKFYRDVVLKERLKNEGWNED